MEICLILFRKYSRMKLAIVIFSVQISANIGKTSINRFPKPSWWVPMMMFQTMIWWTQSHQNVTNARFVLICMIDQVNWKFTFEFTQEKNHSSALYVATDIGMHILWSNICNSILGKNDYLVNPVIITPYIPVD